MYAGTKVNWHEVLMSESGSVALDNTLPLFLCAFSADKGTEEITDLAYADFKKMYGNIANFYKHGQPLLQAHKILAAGGRVLGKRIVAEDSTLANLIITAEVTSKEVAKTNANGEQLYIGSDGQETTEVTDTIATTTYAVIKYDSVTVENIKTVAELKAKADTLQTESVFPIFVIADNGRGESVKKVRIAPDYDTSKKLPYMLYKISDIEGTAAVETQRFSMYPDAVNLVNGVRRNMMLSANTMLQMSAEMNTEACDAFIAKLAEVTGYTIEDLYTFDVLFGKTVKQKEIGTIKIDETGLDITSEYGMELKSGSNGNFGEHPFNGEVASQHWIDQAVAFFDGTFSDEIFDLDQHKIDFCVDANYPDDVKAAIVKLAEFREDFFFFRDLGLNINSIADVQEKVTDLSWTLTPFAGDYMSSYDIIDPFSHKQISVTMTHGLAPLLVNHFINNVAAPIAGEFNNFVISEAIEGTVNVIPRVTPSVNQKEILDDLKVNFVNLTSDGLLAVQSTYTSQDHNGPLSFSSNVIVTQMVIKSIRRYCPKIRFMLMDPSATDFGKYKTLIEDNVISRYAQHFKSIELVYTRDDAQIASKIFNASLYCYYRDFAQGEVFDVFAIEGSPDTNPMA